MTYTTKVDTRGIAARMAAKHRKRAGGKPEASKPAAVRVTPKTARAATHTTATQTMAGPQDSHAQGAVLSVLQVGSAPASPDSRGGIASVISAVVDLPNHRDGVTVEHITTYRDTGRSDQARLASSGLRALRSRLRRAGGKPDVVHVHVSYKGSVLRKAAVLRIARRAHVPTVLHAHSHGFKKWFDSLNPVMRAIVRRSLVADRWIVLGSTLREEYIDMFGLDPNAVVVVPNPVVGAAPATPSHRPAKGAGASGALTGLFLGRLGRRKGCYELLEALASANANRPAGSPEVRLVMAGDGEVEALTAEAERLGVRGQVEFPGWIGPDDRLRLLDQADFFVLPSHEEGLPMAMLEAMGSGLPVIVTPVGAIGEVIRDGENGLLVPPGDASALAGALSRLAADPALRETLGTAAAVTAEDYDVEPWYDRLLALWGELAAPAHRWTTGALPVVDPAATTAARAS